MAGYQIVIVQGNVGRAPEMRYTANGHALTRFSVAVNEHFVSDGERRERTEWVNVVTWGKLAETCGQYLEKGRSVLVEGRLQTTSWEGPDGKKRYRTEVNAKSVVFLDRAPERSHDDADYMDPDDVPFDG